MTAKFLALVEELFGPTGRWQVAVAACLITAAASLWFTLGPAGGERVRLKSAQQLDDYYVEQGYTMQALRAGNAKVPRVFITTVPDNWAKDLDIPRKKSLFFRTLLPLVLQVNADIRADRVRLTGLRKRIAAGEAPDHKDHAWLLELAERYAVVDADEVNAKTLLTSAQLAHLDTRVDIVPPSLALSQSAIESAWALSRFAVEGNALFGQWRYGKGLKPEDQRTELGDYRIATFKTPIASVRGYMKNLNTNPAYRPFRTQRKMAQKLGRVPQGEALAAGVLSYSERGAAYIEEVRRLIRSNGLGGTDTASLKDMEPSKLRAGLF